MDVAKLSTVARTCVVRGYSIQESQFNGGIHQPLIMPNAMVHHAATQAVATIREQG